MYSIALLHPHGEASSPWKAQRYETTLDEAGLWRDGDMPRWLAGVDAREHEGPNCVASRRVASYNWHGHRGELRVLESKMAFGVRDEDAKICELSF